MRKLEFRIWIKDEERYYDEADEESYMILPTGDVLYTSEAYEEDGEWFRDTVNVTKDAIVEQYTGLKDKNGKEIYEGDIVRCSFGESGVVEFRHGAYCVVGDDSSDMSNWKETAFEVIGNIHENPELLKVKNVD